MKMKILYLVSTLRQTGPTNQLLNIVSNLDLKTYEPIIITLSPEPINSMYPNFKEKGINVISLNLSRKKFLTHSYFAIKKLINFYKPNIIHSQGERADFLASFINQNKKIIHLTTLRCYPYEDFKGLYGKKGKLIASIYMKIIKKIDYKVSCSKSLEDIFLYRENIKAFTIQNSVDTKQFNILDSNHKRVLKIEKGFKDDDYIFINTGGLLVRKDPETTIKGFIKAFGDKENIKLLMLGEGQLNKLKDKYKRNKNIIFTGKVNNVREYLQISDVFISSSHSEGLPNAVLEACSTGLPCVLSDIPQHRELVQKDGLFFNLGDDAKLSQDLLSVRKNEWDKNDIHNFIVKNFSAKSMSYKYQKYYRTLVLENEENAY